VCDTLAYVGGLLLLALGATQRQTRVLRFGRPETRDHGLELVLDVPLIVAVAYPAFGLMIWLTKDAISPPPPASTRSTRHGKNTIRNSCTVWIVASLSVKYW